MRLNNIPSEMHSLLASPKIHPKPSFGGGRKPKISTTTAVYLLRFNVSLQIAILAIVVNLVLAISTFYYGLNALYCAFGIDCVIGVTTSSILIWRFATSKQEDLLEQIYLHQKYKCGEADFSTAAKAVKYDLFESSIEMHDPQDHVRELWSTFWLGQVMIISGIGIIIRTIVELVSHAMVEKDADLNKFVDFDSLFEDQMAMMAPLVTLALISLCLNLVLMFFKIFIYYYLASNSMLIEGVNSFISALFASMAVLSIKYSDSMPYLDQTVSIIFGIFLVVYGIFNVMHSVGQTLYQVIKTNRDGYTIVV